ncbi:class I SAM-dependent methyltransferase [Xanthobacter sp. DSM 24535]|uniref:methyltransferase domain-containing protein n=1 Tax=Roseixanthobacter psychrophilus TaxID=3119917 RepID=UPI00372AE747
MRINRLVDNKNQTGERFVFSHTESEVELEHVHRYLLMGALCEGRTVLDAACGEGYGTAILALNALSVDGVDLDAETVATASAKYPLSNIAFRTANVTRLPFEDSRFDVVVSFETIEHIEHQEDALNEFRRVLKPEGLLVISTPNEPVYNHNRTEPNPFHIKELKRSDFESALRGRFRNLSLYGQRVVFGSMVLPAEARKDKIVGLRRDGTSGEITGSGMFDSSMYLLAVCSDGPLPSFPQSLYEGAIPQNALSSLLGGLQERDQRIFELSEQMSKALAGSRRPSPRNLFPDGSGVPLIAVDAPPESDDAAVLDIPFESYDEWIDWIEPNGAILGPDYLSNCAEQIRRDGVLEPISNRYYPAALVSDTMDNWREGFQTGSTISRLRAILLVMARTFPRDKLGELKIYAPEALTPFALLLRGLFPKFVGSEFASDPEVADALYPIPTGDALAKLSLRSDAFDLVITNEALIHEPDVDAALCEIARVLRPGGWHLGTSPFLMMNQRSVVRAAIEDGKIVHFDDLGQPESPPDENAASIFEIPGWDILTRAKKAGFSYASWRYVQSISAGVLTSDVGGVFVLSLQK